VDQDWSRRRGQNAQARAEALARVAAREQAEAEALLVGFARRLLAAGVAPRPLRAVGLGGAGRYRTDVVGWYLRVNRSIGVDAEGNYFVLQVPGGWFGRWRRARLRPNPPPLVVGRGGRDGESVDLKDLLAARWDELTGESGVGAGGAAGGAGGDRPARRRR
jgi:hypothetical protein